MKAHIKPFAKYIKNVENKLTEMLGKAAGWMKINKLTLHLVKIKEKLIGSYCCFTQKTKIKVKYNDQTIVQVHLDQLLDVHIDSNLIWEEQYNYICKKRSQKIQVLKYIRDYLKFDILKMVYSSIILPHMDYAPVVWGKYHNIVNNGRISKLEKRVARVILRCKIRYKSS